MTPEEKERMAVICERITIEKDQEEFSRLVDELNELLARKESRLEKTRKIDSVKGHEGKQSPGRR